MHSLPEANYINPAVQIDCGLFIGLPLVSSFHLNLANSGFKAGDYAILYTDGTVKRDRNFDPGVVAKRNYFISEIHSTLLAVGIQRNKYYYNFTITEKNNTAVTYGGEFFSFAVKGTDEFEGQSISAQRTIVKFDHLREYAVGVSRKYSSNLTLGIKAKLLFGKLNFSTAIESLDIYIPPGTSDLVFDVSGGFNTSSPYALREEAPGTYRFYEQYEAPMLKHLLNARNPGFAMDIGFIYKYSDRLTFSGSLLDLGLVFYRSNLGNYHVEGNYTYQGPLGGEPLNREYLLGAFDELNANMTVELSQDPYVSFLDPRLYLGAAYKPDKRFDLNFLLYNRLLPGKLQTGVTVSVLTRPVKALETSISWSYMNRSPFNLGLGVIYGKNPVQLYLVSDNIIGFIWPLSTKNINLRLGINLNLGCRAKFNIDQCGCEWLKKADERRIRMDKFRQRKKR
jgi:hypothetical protein